jgi:hypothetical protein
MPAIMTSGMVNSSSRPDRLSPRGGLARGVSLVGWSSVADTIAAFGCRDASLKDAIFEDAFRPRTGQITDR